MLISIIIINTVIDNRIKLWNYGDGKCLKTYKGHSNGQFYTCNADYLLENDEYCSQNDVPCIQIMNLMICM